ncbi:MAG: zf-TFIIB domain-containing protein [Deltaproteobacteria bacterium]|nr:zf-TFIIB domain-containing protein [Deltaproteobacteria bacterium]
MSSTQKPHEAEEEYFARLEVEKKHKLAEKKKTTLAEQELKELEKTHNMRCSGCGFELETVVFKGFSVHKCFHCGGAFLSAEAFQKLCGQDSRSLESFMNIFRFK